MTLRWHSAGEADVPVDSSWLDERESVRLEGMTFSKRHDEARLSRYTAKRTIGLASGLDPGDLGRITIGNEPTGAPVAFLDGRRLGMEISMTDRAGWAVCALGEARLGVDLELVEPRSPLFVNDYFTPREQALVGRGSSELVANLVWSAKESALKVLQTGLRRDTRTVEVDLNPDDELAEGWRALQVRDLIEGAVFDGFWARYGSFVLTIASSGNASAPIELMSPPPLADAAPAHTWMDRPRR